MKPRFPLVILAVLLMTALAATDALAVFAGTDVFLPSVGRKPGAAGSQWYTTVWVYNPNASAVNLTFYLLERDKDNSAASIYNDTLPAGDTRRYDNAIWTMFAKEVFGALRVTASQAVIVNSRIYSMGSGETGKDSVGQFFAAIPASFAIASGQSTQILGVYETAPSASSEFRYNFGFVETAGASANLLVTAYDETGASLASKAYTLLPYEQRQFRFPDEFPGLSTTNARLQAEVTSGSGKAVVFGSGIGNVSNDPSTFEMSFSSSLLVGGGSGAFTLPYDGSTSSAGMAFSVTNTAGPAVQGWSQVHDGVTGITNGTSRSGVYGKADKAGSFGVYGENTAATGITAGVFGKAASSNGGIGVSGWAPATTGVAVGVWGQTETPGDLSTGVVGLARAATGKTYGVWGNALSTQGYGVYGQNGQSGTGDTNHRGGVWGDSLDGQGVLGTSKNSIGVGGISLGGNAVQGIAIGGGNSGVGVLGYAMSGANWGGRFQGNVSVSGTLSKGGGSFLIDHPLDPAGKYLYHSFVESPDMMNIYNGNVVTNAAGEATITLPDYFSALNRDFRYQLTVIGSFAQAIVANEIENNQFTIKTDKPNVKVSWQVTGIRHDAFANAHRIPVEVVKPAEEQGTFLHPAELGQPDEKNLVWVHQPALMNTAKEMLERNEQR